MNFRQVALASACQFLAHVCSFAQHESDLEFQDTDPYTAIAILDHKDQITCLHLSHTLENKSIPFRMHGSRVHVLEVPESFKEVATEAIKNADVYDSPTVKIEELEEDEIVRISEDDSNSFSKRIGVALSKIPEVSKDKNELLLAAFKRLFADRDLGIDQDLHMVEHIEGHVRHYLSADDTLLKGFEVEILLSAKPNQKVRCRIQVYENFKAVCLLSIHRSRKS